MNILNSSAFRIFKNNAEIFYNRTLKDNLYDYQLKGKIRRLLKAEPRKDLAENQKREIRLYYKKRNIKNLNTEWHKFYMNCNGKFAVEYVPENLFYVKILPALNEMLFLPALADKNLLERLFPSVKQPETVIKNTNGFFFHNDKLITFDNAVEHCNIVEKMIIKPTIGSGGGKNILLFSGQNDTSGKGSIAKMLRDYKKNYIVQKVVDQHPDMKRLNPTSLNTVRIMTFLKESEVVVLSTVVRIGRKGAFTDNATTGGIPCGVQFDGWLNEIAFDLSGKRYTETDNGIKLKDIQLPFMDEIRNVAKTLHADMPYFRLISWDIAIDANGDILVIEHNSISQDINFHQLNNGPVLAPILEEYVKIVES